jgi:hypothetical protein
VEEHYEDPVDHDQYETEHGPEEELEYEEHDQPADDAGTESTTKLPFLGELLQKSQQSVDMVKQLDSSRRTLEADRESPTEHITIATNTAPPPPPLPNRIPNSPITTMPPPPAPPLPTRPIDSKRVESLPKQTLVPPPPAPVLVASPPPTPVRRIDVVMSPPPPARETNPADSVSLLPPTREINTTRSPPPLPVKSEPKTAAVKQPSNLEIIKATESLRKTAITENPTLRTSTNVIAPGPVKSNPWTSVSLKKTEKKTTASSNLVGSSQPKALPSRPDKAAADHSMLLWYF